MFPWEAESSPGPSARGSRSPERPYVPEAVEPVDVRPMGVDPLPATRNVARVPVEAAPGGGIFEALVTFFLAVAALALAFMLVMVFFQGL